MALFCHIVKVLFLDGCYPVGIGIPVDIVYVNILAETRVSKQSYTYKGI